MRTGNRTHWTHNGRAFRFAIASVQAIALVAGSGAIVPALAQDGFATGDLVCNHGDFTAFNVSNLGAITATTLVSNFNRGEGIAFDGDGNLYVGSHGLEIYDSAFQYIGSAPVADPIGDRAYYLARREGQVVACNPVRTPYARLFVFNTQDIHAPFLENTVNIPDSNAFGGLECRGLAFDPDGFLWVTGYITLTKLSLDGLGNPVAYETFQPGGNPFDVAFEPLTGRLFYTAVNENSVRLLDRGNPHQQTGRILNVCDNAINSPKLVRFASNGDMFVSCSNSGGATTDIVAFDGESLVGLTGDRDASTLEPVRIAHPMNGAEFLAFRPSPHVAPTVAITGPPSGTLLTVGSPGTFTGSFTDPGILDTHTALWEFCSGTSCTTLPGNVTESGGAGTVTNDMTFTSAGIYIITLSVTDNNGATGTANTVAGLSAFVVVYDPEGGFVTGGGWFDSPPGAFTADSSLTGKATFGFVSRYHRGASVPTGQTEFQFKAGNLNFHSSEYDWLVVPGPKAMFKGTGTVNGAGGYGFLITGWDGQRPGGGGQDKFRIKIRNVSTDQIIYDNQVGASESADPTTMIGGGSIVIHAN